MGTRSKQPARTRAEIVEQLVDLFFVHGYNATTLSLISAHTGLGRASLYHHFPGGKEEMARAVLERADSWGEKFVCAVLEDQTRDPAERLCSALDNMDKVHHSPAQLPPSTALVVGEGAARYRDHIQGYYASVIGMITDILQQLGLPHDVAQRRAWEYQILWEGALACSRVMNDMGVFRQVMKNMPALLLAPAEQTGCLPADAVFPPLPPVEPNSASAAQKEGTGPLTHPV